jgi:hypothetical protein
MKKQNLFTPIFIIFGFLSFAQSQQTNNKSGGWYAGNNRSINSIMIIDYSFSNACEGDSTQFINTSSISGDSFLYFLWNFGDTTSPIKTSFSQNTKHKYHYTGKYTVELIAITYSGLKDTISKTIYILPIPIAIITQNGNTLYSNGVFDSVQWYDSTGAISGAIGPSYMPTKKGYYWVKITDSNGCKSNASNKIFYNPTLIYEKENSNIILVYPNPNSGILNVELNINGQKEIMIYNLLGIEMMHKVTSENLYKIDLSGKPSGIYMVVVKTDHSVYRNSFIKQ